MRRVVFALVLLQAHSATARRHPRFEPTDLELEKGGSVELDMQLGYTFGRDANRIVLPDFELDLGILDDVELDIDGAYAIEGGDSALDNLWLAAKSGLWLDAWNLGVELGPKLPLAAMNHGVGVEGLVLVGHSIGRVHAVVDAGGLVDPRDDMGERPEGVEAGVDLDVDIVRDRWAVLAEVGGVHYVSTDPDQLAAGAGVQYSLSHVDLSVVAVVGLAQGSDKLALLLGVSPEVRLW